MGSFTDEQRAKGRATMRSRAKMKNREEKMQQDIFEARERGLSIPEVAKECHTNEKNVRKVLFNGVHKAERVARFNEAMVSMSPAGIKVVREWLDKGDKDVAMWLLKETGVVGKEQVNITVNAQNAQVNLSNDTLEAARAVAEQMRMANGPKQLQQAADDIMGEIVSTNEEVEDEQSRDNVGITTNDEQRDRSGAESAEGE
jgi:hypothetical protein